MLLSTSSDYIATVGIECTREIHMYMYMHVLHSLVTLLHCYVTYYIEFSASSLGFISMKGVVAATPDNWERGYQHYMYMYVAVTEN